MNLKVTEINEDKNNFIIVKELPEYESTELPEHKKLE